MPLSLRLPVPLEMQIAQLAAHRGTSKTALIIQSVEQLLQREAVPTAHDLYAQVMSLPEQESVAESQAALRPMETRQRKLDVRDAVRAKHARRQIAAKA